MATQNQQVQSGNRIVVELDGKTVGLIQSLRMSDSYGLEDASGIGDIHVVEHVPSKAVHSLSVSQMVLKRGHLRDRGISLENGDAALEGLVFDIAVYSKDTGEKLRSYKSCSYDSGDLDVSAHRIVMASGQLKALDVTGTGI